jgi:uncharacterized low-complexity protein
MAILALAGALLLAAAQPQSAPAASPAPRPEAAPAQARTPAPSTPNRQGGVKVGAGDVNATSGKAHETRPTDFAPAPSGDPTAIPLLLPAKQTAREAAH